MIRQVLWLFYLSLYPSSCLFYLWTCKCYLWFSHLESGIKTTLFVRLFRESNKWISRLFSWHILSTQLIWYSAQHILSTQLNVYDVDHGWKCCYEYGWLKRGQISRSLNIYFVPTGTSGKTWLPLRRAYHAHFVGLSVRAHSHLRSALFSDCSKNMLFLLKIWRVQSLGLMGKLPKFLRIWLKISYLSKNIFHGVLRFLSFTPLSCSKNDCPTKCTKKSPTVFITCSPIMVVWVLSIFKMIVQGKNYYSLWMISVISRITYYFL